VELLRHHLRPLGVALATLALSAGVVFAGGGASMPDAASDGLERAAEASGKTVPVRLHEVVEEEPVVEDEPVVEEEPVVEDEPVVEEEPVDDQPCPVLDEYETHGAKVCAAAQGEVPEGYANRGEYVREVARANHGAEVAAEKAANGGRPDAAGKAKERAAQKAAERAGRKSAPAGRP
jgi:hypothetical protein